MQRDEYDQLETAELPHEETAVHHVQRAAKLEIDEKL